MSMNSKDVENILQITDMIARFGIPMVASVMKTIKEQSPTIEQIYMLRQTIKDPDEYFTDSGEIKPIPTTTTTIEEFAKEEGIVDDSSPNAEPNTNNAVEKPLPTIE